MGVVSGDSDREPDGRDATRELEHGILRRISEARKDERPCHEEEKVQGDEDIVLDVILGLEQIERIRLPNEDVMDDFLAVSRPCNPVFDPLQAYDDAILLDAARGGTKTPADQHQDNHNPQKEMGKGRHALDALEPGGG